jgi:NADH-quinone oxidoreductase subunit F
MTSSDLAPVLELLHERQQRSGQISEGDIAALAPVAGISPAELYAVITAYPRFRLAPGPGAAVCCGPACALHGSREVAQALGVEGKASCLGLCDQPVALLTDEGPRIARPTDPARPEIPAAPSVTIGVPETAFFGDEDPLDAVVAAVRRPPEEIIRIVDESGLQGRGGAAFPTGRKWAALRGATAQEKYLVCNADESEPGTFKDRTILDHQARRLLAGMRIAAHAIGATRGIIYLRCEYARQLDVLNDEIQRLRDEGHLGAGFDVVIRRGAGAYVCGEESALLNSLEGRRPIPRDRPPYPTTSGLFGAPTLVQNVETLAAVPAILHRGGAWYRNAGQPKLYCVSGDVAAPGVFELPMSTTARELLDLAGCDLDSIQAFTLGGLSGGLLSPEALDLRLDFETVRTHGAHLGSGALIAIDASRCLLGFVREALRFFAEESCGKCFPCRLGTLRLRERLEALSAGETAEQEEIREIILALDRGAACGLGVAAGMITRDLLGTFGREVAAHGRGGCSAGARR